MRNLENYGVQELSLSESKEVDGGSWVVALIAVAIAVIKLVKKVGGKPVSNTVTLFSGGGGGGTGMANEQNVRIY